MTEIFYLFFSLSYLIYVFRKLAKDIHMLQLNSYSTVRYIKWIRNNPSKIFLLTNIAPFLSLISLFSRSIPSIFAFSSAIYLILSISRKNSIHKKPLVYTNRVKRLFFSILASLCCAFFFTIAIHFTLQTSIIIIVATSLLSSFSFLLVIYGNLLNMPIERLIGYYYYRDARKIIRNSKILPIGITGSYGKTSTKHILYKILSDSYNVLMTPESYNTTMGVVKTIRNCLKPIHEIFLVEMGARNRGDIKEICNLIKPRVGIITTIGEQHLETFRNIERIILTKYELIEALPENGTAFLNMDNKYIAQFPKPPKLKQCICYGMNFEGELDYRLSDLKVNSKGSSFKISKKDGTKVHFQTKLLGKYNAYNIIASVAVASELGMNLERISGIVRRVKPIPHRMELKSGLNNVTVIDDSFNSNPLGCQMALETVASMEESPKVLITPGMVELGEKEYEFNKNFGLMAAEVFDYIILVGAKRTQAIKDGLNQLNYPISKYSVVNNLNEAVAQLRQIMKPGGVVLFENDLPDTYDE